MGRLATAIQLDSFESVTMDQQALAPVQLINTRDPEVHPSRDLEPKWVRIRDLELLCLFFLTLIYLASCVMLGIPGNILFRKHSGGHLLLNQTRCGLQGFGFSSQTPLPSDLAPF